VNPGECGADSATSYVTRYDPHFPVIGAPVRLTPSRREGKTQAFRACAHDAMHKSEREREDTKMLRRKWIIDNAGHLRGVWIDSGQPSSAPINREVHPILNAARAGGLRKGVGRQWLRQLRFGRVAACLTLPAVCMVFLSGAAWADGGGKITGTVRDQSGGVNPPSRVSAANTTRM